MTTDSAIKQLKRMKIDKERTGDEYNAITFAIEELENKHLVPQSYVSKATFDQVMWERDIAISQLAQAGVSLGEKAAIVRIDRVLNILDRYYLWHLDENGNYVTVGEEIKAAVLALKGGEQG